MQRPELWESSLLILDLMDLNVTGGLILDEISSLRDWQRDVLRPTADAGGTLTRQALIDFLVAGGSSPESFPTAPAYDPDQPLVSSVLEQLLGLQADVEADPDRRVEIDDLPGLSEPTREILGVSTVSYTALYNVFNQLSRALSSVADIYPDMDQVGIIGMPGLLSAAAKQGLLLLAPDGVLTPERLSGLTPLVRRPLLWRRLSDLVRQIDNSGDTETTLQVDEVLSPNDSDFWRNEILRSLADEAGEINHRALVDRLAAMEPAGVGGYFPQPDSPDPADDPELPVEFDNSPIGIHLLFADEWPASPEASDLNGDGQVNFDDFFEWVDEAVGSIPRGVAPEFDSWMDGGDAADLNRDGMTDRIDFFIHSPEAWLAGPSASDFSGNGDIDGSDYSRWIDRGMPGDVPTDPDELIDPNQPLVSAVLEQLEFLQTLFTSEVYSSGDHLTIDLDRSGDLLSDTRQLLLEAASQDETLDLRGLGIAFARLERALILAQSQMPAQDPTTIVIDELPSSADVEKGWLTMLSPDGGLTAERVEGLLVIVRRPLLRARLVWLLERLDVDLDLTYDLIEGGLLFPWLVEAMRPVADANGQLARQALADYLIEAGFVDVESMPPRPGPIDEQQLLVSPALQTWLDNLEGGGLAALSRTDFDLAWLQTLIEERSLQQVGIRATSLSDFSKEQLLQLVPDGVMTPERLDGLLGIVRPPLLREDLFRLLDAIDVDASLEAVFLDDVPLVNPLREWEKEALRPIADAEGRLTRQALADQLMTLGVSPEDISPPPGGSFDPDQPLVSSTLEQLLNLQAEFETDPVVDSRLDIRLDSRPELNETARELLLAAAGGYRLYRIDLHNLFRQLENPLSWLQDNSDVANRRGDFAADQFAISGLSMFPEAQRDLLLLLSPDGVLTRERIAEMLSSVRGPILWDYVLRLKTPIDTDGDGVAETFPLPLPTTPDAVATRYPSWVVDALRPLADADGHITQQALEDHLVTLALPPPDDEPQDCGTQPAVGEPAPPDVELPLPQVLEILLEVDARTQTDQDAITNLVDRAGVDDRVRQFFIDSRGGQIVVGVDSPGAFSQFETLLGNVTCCWAPDQDVVTIADLTRADPVAIEWLSLLSEDGSLTRDRIDELQQVARLPLLRDRLPSILAEDPAPVVFSLADVDDAHPEWVIDDLRPIANACGEITREALVEHSAATRQALTDFVGTLGFPDPSDGSPVVELSVPQALEFLLAADVEFQADPELSSFSVDDFSDLGEDVRQFMEEVGAGTLFRGQTGVFTLFSILLGNLVQQAPTQEVIAVEELVQMDPRERDGLLLLALDGLLTRDRIDGLLDLVRLPLRRDQLSFILAESPDQDAFRLDDLNLRPWLRDDLRPLADAGGEVTRQALDDHVAVARRELADFAQSAGLLDEPEPSPGDDGSDPVERSGAVAVIDTQAGFIELEPLVLALPDETRILDGITGAVLDSEALQPGDRLLVDVDWDRDGNAIAREIIRDGEISTGSNALALRFGTLEVGPEGVPQVVELSSRYQLSDQTRFGLNGPGTLDPGQLQAGDRVYMVTRGSEAEAVTLLLSAGEAELPREVLEVVLPLLEVDPLRSTLLLGSGRDIYEVATDASLIDDETGVPVRLVDVATLVGEELRFQVRRPHLGDPQLFLIVGIGVTGFVPLPEGTITIDFDLGRRDQQMRQAGNAVFGKSYRVQLNTGEAPPIEGWSVTVEYDPEDLSFVEGSFVASDFIRGLHPLVDVSPGRIDLGGSALSAGEGNGEDATLGEFTVVVQEGFTGRTELRITGNKLNPVDGAIIETEVLHTAVISADAAESQIPGDFDGNGAVEFQDFFVFADGFQGGDLRFDLDGDGLVGFSDLFIFSDNFGRNVQMKILALGRELFSLPDDDRLYANYPNPFNASTTIPFELTSSGQVRLDVFDAIGQRIRQLHSGSLGPGRHRAVWDARDGDGLEVSTGIYLVRLQTPQSVSTTKLLLAR